MGGIHEKDSIQVKYANKEWQRWAIMHHGWIVTNGLILGTGGSGGRELVFGAGGEVGGVPNGSAGLGNCRTR